MEVRPSQIEGTQTGSGVVSSPSGTGARKIETAILPADAFHPTGGRPVEATPLEEINQDPPTLLVALDDQVRPNDVPETLPVMEDSSPRATPAQASRSVTLSEAIRQAVYTPHQALPPKQEQAMQFPEVRVGEPVARSSRRTKTAAPAPASSQTTTAPRKKASRDSTTPRTTAPGSAAPRRTNAPVLLHKPSTPAVAVPQARTDLPEQVPVDLSKPARIDLPEQAPTDLSKLAPIDLPELPPTLAARTMRALRQVENLLLSAIGKGDPILDLQPELEAINRLGPQMENLSDAELKAMTGRFRARLAAGESLDDLRVEAFAVAREAAFRSTGMRPYDVQVLGALALGRNQIAEMKAGEGKTLTGVLPVYLNALAAQGAHVVTVNETLAQRDCEWMGPVFRSLGLSVGLVDESMSPEERRAGYEADITYLNNSTLGLDHLRDQTVQSPSERVQRAPFYALLDEVDEILLDEARSPLILSTRDLPPEEEYRLFAEIVAAMSPGVHYQVDRQKNQAWVTEEGLKVVESRLGIGNLFDEENLPHVAHLQKAIEARSLFVRDRDYVVADGKLMILDEFTGRVMEDRRYNDGLHQALEAREGLEIQAEQRTLASISHPNLFRRYPRLAGMSGTARTEEKEFQALYGLSVVSIPTNKPVLRVDHPDLVFRTRQDKFAAILDQAESLFCEGQPVLIGTRSSQVNDYLSELLTARGIPHQVLNSKSVKDNTQAENEILAGAGSSGMVTLATDVTGCGVDIKPDMVNYKKLAIEVSERTSRGQAVVVDLARTEEAEALARWLEMGQIPTIIVDHEVPAPGPGEALLRLGVASSVPEPAVFLKGSDYPTGGLFVVGTERHDSRRSDDRLRGRAGHQGQMGSSRFYVSLEDDLLRHHVAPKTSGLLDRLGVPRNQGTSDPLVGKLTNAAQEAVEKHHFAIRQKTTRYDQVLDQHRELFYADRDQILEGADLREVLLDWGGAWLADEIMGGRDPRKPIPPQELADRMEQLEGDLGVPLPALQIDKPLRMAELTDLMRAELAARYEVIEERFGSQALREQERWMTIQAMDRSWTEHLESLVDLQHDIDLVACGEQSPWNAYQEKATEIFAETRGVVARDVAQDLFGEILREVPHNPSDAA